jgi:2-dehydro-3-deoxyphosphooctonate aldolase (KDO 8-P synthase)
MAIDNRIQTPEICFGNIRVGGDAPALIISGPDSLESRDLALEIARHLADIADRLDITAVFKGSYYKANRSSHESYRGPGLEEGLRILEAVRAETGLPVTSDVHSPDEALAAGEVLDIIQIPAFLCRQNDLLQAAAKTGKIVNIKKGQFLSPHEVKGRVAAATGPNTPGVLVTERGSFFGYGELVNDMKSVPRIRSEGVPLIFDVSHSVQRPAALGNRSGGDSELIPHLARAAAGAGCDGYFFEVHPEPEKSLCDGPSSLVLSQLESLLEDLIAIDRISRRNPKSHD